MLAATLGGLRGIEATLMSIFVSRPKLGPLPIPPPQTGGQQQVTGMVFQRLYKFRRILNV